MSARTTVLSRALLAGLLALLLVGGAFGGWSAVARADSAPLDPADPATPATVAADALPTVQINGVAWSQVVVGNTVYVAGSFTSARPAGAPAGTQETPRGNLLAYDIRTGQLITTFAPSLNAQALVVSASPDGTRIYVGGDFTTADGQSRNRIAAYSTATGQLIPTFRPSVNSQVRAIAATNTTVYIGGHLSAVGSTPRARLAAVRASDGAVLPWAPQPGVGPTDGNRLRPVRDANGNWVPNPKNSETSNAVRALVIAGPGGQVVAAGHFDTLNGVKATGVGALDGVTGETRPFAINQLITNQGVNAAVTSLTTDGVNVYGTGYDYYGPGNLEGSFSATADGGAVVAISDCKGDHYSSYPMAGALYAAGHPHDCSNIGGFPEENPRINKYATAYSLAAVGVVGPNTIRNGNFRGQPAPALLPWFPTMAMGTFTKQYQAGWTVTGDGRYVVMGGEFPRVNNTPQQGLVRFAVPSIAPNEVAPTDTEGLTPSVVSVSAGTARVSWQAASDNDNENVTYRVVRNGDTAAPVFETTAASTFWNRPTMSFVDRGLTPGATYTYRVHAYDPFDNSARGSTVSVVVSDATAGPYADAVLADSASHYWRLGEASGDAYDLAGTADLAVGSGVTRGTTGAIAGDADTAATFDGSGEGRASTQTRAAGPNVFSIEAWFRTTTTSGGKIVGYGNESAGNSSTYDRHIYMDESGRLSFGVWTGAMSIVQSGTGLNDGTWHHVVGSMSSAGLALSVDGRLVDSRGDITAGQPYDGFWRIGGDSSWAGSNYFAGDIDDVAIYPAALSTETVAQHYSLAASGAPANNPPTAMFTSSVTDLHMDVDAGSSADADGQIVGYAWDFGDGTTATGKTAAHDYATGGTYTVTLTVTDDDGAASTSPAQVTVTAPPVNQAPTAAFTSSADALTLSVDGGGSSDPDGTITGYAWTFGDGTSGSGATASHSYAAAGSYAVTLTVTDDDGATASSTQTVSVTAPAGPPVLARDSFDRTVSGGLGTADVGGAWTVGNGGARQSVAPGVATLNLAAPGNLTGSYLAGVSQTGADVLASFSLGSAPTGTGVSVYVTGRRVALNQEYRGRVRFLSNGAVAVAVTRLSGSASEVVIGAESIVSGLTYAPGTALQVRVRVTGTNPTQVALTVWRAGTAEPSAPSLTRTDSTASLQAPGGLGVSAYLSGSATSPTAVRFTSYSVTAVG